MKRILLTTALVGFAGAAAADGHLGVTFSGAATLGYNDTNSGQVDATADGDDSDALVLTDAFDNEEGFYSDLDVTIGFAAELDNGLTAAASIDLVDLADGAADGADYELSLTSETAGLYYGDTAMAAASKFSEVGDMGIDFSTRDGEAVLRGEVTMGGVDTAVSYVIDEQANALEQLSVGVAASFDSFDVTVGYQAAASAAYAASAAVVGTDADGDTVFADAQGDFNANELIGFTVGTTLGGADLGFGYISDQTASTNAWGVSVAYPVGPVTVSASYADNSASGEAWDLGVDYENGPVAVSASYDQSDDWALEGSYDVGNGLTAFAGIADAGQDFYVAGSYDLGSGASMLVSYADDGDTDSEDEIGDPGYQEGTTVEISFEF